MYTGVLQKMITEIDNPVNYYLDMEDGFIHMNQLLDREIRFEFVKYRCSGCGADKKIFRQGYCYDCFYALPQAGDWVMHPELSKAHLGIEDRDLAYEKKAQLQPHTVYLANSSNVKVGVTRSEQVPTRWIDQGAHEAIVIAEVPNRYLAGVAEVALKQHVADKTNWRAMLTNNIKDLDLQEEREKLLKYIPEAVKPYIVTNAKEVEIEFPVIQYPAKVRSVGLEKNPEFGGKLKGIKGQYLLFEGGTVFNVRNWEGYVVNLRL